MKGDNTIIQHLNKLLANEMIAINQYFLHGKLCLHWGYQKLGNKIYAESIDEMKHADILTERILFLEGTPFLTLNKLNIGKTAHDILKNDLRLELEGLLDLQAAIRYADSIDDYGSKSLFQTIYDSEEEHINWLETQLELIDQIGLNNYLQLQI